MILTLVAVGLLVAGVVGSLVPRVPEQPFPCLASTFIGEGQGLMHRER